MPSPQPVFQVSEFIETLNHHLALLGLVTIEGEISRLDVKNGRLIFATIKDAQSALDVFSLTNMISNFSQLEPGMLVHVTGTAGFYKGSGKFRLFASAITPEGEGSLQLAYEKLKAQLAAEGLFAPERKRPLPPWPKTIGLVTTKNSSACADLIKILRARMPNLFLKILPVNVQGRDALPSILQAFTYIQSHTSAFDIVIMARGGGSLEDLAAFNSEEICRAVYACEVPVVSAIGHEDNWSLTDFVADLRASTPSNAAELVVRDHREVLQEIIMNHRLIYQRLLQTVSQLQATVDRSHQTIRHQVQTHAALVAQAVASFPRLREQLLTTVANRAQAIAYLERLLASLDYRRVLKRGYSITRTSKGNIIKSSQEVNPTDAINTQLADGEITSIVQ